MNKITVTVLALLAVNAGVASAATKLPGDLMYLGKPIDSLCFSRTDRGDILNLKDCGAAKEKYTISGKNTDLIKKGYTGFDWQDNSNADYKAQGYSYYKAFDAGQQQYWIYSINGTGGSGDFTTIDLAKRIDPTTLSFKNLAGGDRCNGGIQDVTNKNHQLTYSASFSAFDLLILANDNPHNLKAYDDLASCATCCAGKILYEVGSDKKINFKYVELDKVTKTEEMSSQGKYQACFNKIYASYVTKGETKLDEAKLKKFVKEFNTACVK